MNIVIRAYGLPQAELSSSLYHIKVYTRPFLVIPSPLPGEGLAPSTIGGSQNPKCVWGSEHSLVLREMKGSHDSRALSFPKKLGHAGVSVIAWDSERFVVREMVL